MPLWWRPDGDYVKDLSRIRRMIPYVMDKRNESIVFYDQKVNVEKLDLFLENFEKKTGRKITYMPLIVWAVVQVMKERPRLNRFVAGRRIYQRRGLWITFSAKKGKTDKHPLVTVKRKFDPESSFSEILAIVDEAVGESRSDKETYTDKEMKALLKLPVFLLGTLIRLQKWLDNWGLLPGSFYQTDPLYSSVFLANLGSINVDSAYHHLYEYGSIPLFMVFGKANDEVVVGENRQPVVRRLMTVRYNFDERVEDALYCYRGTEIFRERLEDPGKFIDLENL